MTRTALGALSQLLWPLTCPVCGAAGSWCVRCRPTTQPLLVDRRGIGPIAAGAAYRDGTAAAIRAWKLAGRRDLTGPLAAVLAPAVALLAGGSDVALVPIPVRRASRRRRGRDAVGELADAAAGQSSARRVLRALQWERQVPDQVGCGPEQRHRNVAGAMIATRSLAGPVLVVDDVLTTGATAAEAARAVAAAGAHPVAVCVVAIAGGARADAQAAAAGG